MVLSLALATVFRQITPDALISKMFVRYYEAKTLSGTIHTSQSASGVTLVTDTKIAYERPSKMRLDQKQQKKDGRSRFLVSDGKMVAYTPPERLITNQPYFVEQVGQANGEMRPIGDLYVLVASDLPDRSPVLDALIARRDDLTYFKNQLSNLQLTGKVTLEGQTANVIEGNWKETNLRMKGEKPLPANAQVQRDRFKLYITDAGDLLRYELTQRFAVPTDGANKPPSTEPIVVTTVWEAAISVGTVLKPDAFALKG